MREQLTAKQKAFVDLYESGEAPSMKAAYRMAFDNYTASDATISPKASRLLAQPKVRAYQNKLRRAVTRELLASRTRA